MQIAFYKLVPSKKVEKLVRARKVFLIIYDHKPWINTNSLYCEVNVYLTCNNFESSLRCQLSLPCVSRDPFFSNIHSKPLLQKPTGISKSSLLTFQQVFIMLHPKPVPLKTGQRIAKSTAWGLVNVCSVDKMCTVLTIMHGLQGKTAC